MTAPGVNPDAHVQIVTGFRYPSDAWESQGRITAGEQMRWAKWLQRHSHRETRNKHRIEFAKRYFLLSRSIDSWGSIEAARVASMRVTGERNLLDNLLNQPTEQQPTTILDKLRGTGPKP